MYVVKKIVHPALEVHIGGLAATHEGIDNCSILSRVMIATEQIILSADRNRPYRVFYQIIIYTIFTVHRVMCQLPHMIKEVVHGLSYRTFRKDFAILRKTHFSNEQIIGYASRLRSSIRCCSFMLSSSAIRSTS